MKIIKYYLSAHLDNTSKTIKEEASGLGLPYVNKRWLGGTLTNWKTIRGSIRRLHDIEEMVSYEKN